VQRKNRTQPVSYVGQLKVPAGELYESHITSIIVAHHYISLIGTAEDATVCPPNEINLYQSLGLYMVNGEEGMLPEQGFNKDA